MAMTNHDYSAEDEIADVRMERSHVVILGAGASLQASPHGDRNGRALPLVNNFIKVVGLESLLTAHKVHFAENENFEDLYSRIRFDPGLSACVEDVEQAVQSYFSELELPETPTIYDHLVLSLRSKDVIATFNWDPFLFAAAQRNHHVPGLPHILYLHGAVNISYCKDCNTKGYVLSMCQKCDGPRIPTRLLYPVSQKNYIDDEFVKLEWDALRKKYLKNAYVLTIVGYGAPKSDVEAVSLLSEGWGELHSRSLEQIEIIDMKSEDDLREIWRDFIHTHHYSTIKDFYDSWIAQHPRRTCEAMWAQLMEIKYFDGRPFPREDNLGALQKLYRPLIEAERANTAK
jgi:hypothetical protein